MTEGDILEKVKLNKKILNLEKVIWKPITGSRSFNLISTSYTYRLDREYI